MTKIKSDGGSSSYYEIPTTCKTIEDVAKYKGLVGARSELFCLCYLYSFVNDFYVERQTLSSIYYLSQLIKSNNSLTMKPFYALPQIRTDSGALPEHTSELRHLISYAAMGKSRSDIFKALYRMGQKEGASDEYDLNKIIFFGQDLNEIGLRGEYI
jgi:hypothetical protein